MVNIFLIRTENNSEILTIHTKLLKFICYFGSLFVKNSSNNVSHKCKIFMSDSKITSSINRNYL